MDQSGADHFGQLCEIVAKLRAPGGCPWDREQTHESLLPALIEEAYEVAGALRAGDDANFREELGDLLLLIVMHAEIARESGAVLKQWESIKRTEKTGKHYLDSLPAALPALMRAQKVQSKVARVSFDWAEVHDVIAKVEEELGELKQAVASQAQSATGRI